MLGGIVGGLATVAAQTGHRRVNHDIAVRLDQIRQRFFGEIEQAIHIDREQLVPDLIRHMLDFAALKNAGIGHHHIQMAELFDHGLH